MEKNTIKLLNFGKRSLTLMFTHIRTKRVTCNSHKSLTLQEPTPENDQTYSNNSSARADELSV